ncbi:MAG: hypothetical protein RIE73_01360 [Coleofasciculus sp. C1-SOL-03]|uniref:hypothetical protein n=1 Tax=Coleofasciculus sp. C1-SOL-03 TaxID=3069522 RepID=UPI0032FDAE05
MYVSKQTTNELVIQREKATWLHKVFAFFLLSPFWAVAFALVGLLLSPFSIFTLSCNRVEATLVECEYTHDELFGLIKEPIIKTGLTKEAKLITDHSVALVIVDGRANILNSNIIYESSNHEAVATLASGINSFINSNESSLILKRINWEEEQQFIGAYIFILLFTYMWISRLISITRSMIYDAKSRSFTLNKITNSFIDKHGNKVKQYELSKINNIEQNKYESSDIDEPNTHTVFLVLYSGERCLLMATFNENKALLVKQTIDNFIQE